MPDNPKYYVLVLTADGRAWVLHPGASSKATAEFAISWQAKGGTPRETMALCTWSPERRAFVRAGGEPLGAALWRGPYTVEGWEGFLSQLPKGAN